MPQAHPLEQTKPCREILRVRYSVTAFAPILLVHGAWHGAWCWSRVIPRIEAKGRKVLAIDLPGLGDDPTDPKLVTMQSWTDRIVTALEDLGEAAIVVGHSLGGAAITAAAEEAPDRISKLVYLCAFVPRNGESVADLAQTFALSERSAIRTEASEDGAATAVTSACIVSAFYEGCSMADVVYARAHLRPVPNGPIQAKLSLSENREGRVSKVYIECTRDQSIPLDMQRAMAASAPCFQTHSLDSSHSPFFSMPEALADVLTRC